MTLGTHTGVCDNLEGWDGEGEGRKVQERRTFVYLWLIILIFCRKQLNSVKQLSLN